MKKIIILILCFSIHTFTFSQVLENIDVISPFHEGLSAIKKGSKWAFINNKGEKIIDFRDDLVSSNLIKDSNPYPLFVEGKCLIKKLINDTYYYGYIDKNGTTIIEPKYINATNFKDGYAIIIKLEKSDLGTNVFGNKISTNKLDEYIIDTDGNFVKYLENIRNYVLSKTKKAPNFESKFIAPHLIAIKNKDGKWRISKF